MIIKNGYDRAFATIFDSNMTTILTCVIIYYVGSEEVKGFGLTLGWGIALNLFTAVFVTRAFFDLWVRAGVKKIKMLGQAHAPTISWMRLRRMFIPVSIAVMAVSLGLFVATPDRTV